MKRIFTYSILLLLSIVATAQYDPSMSQYMHNRYAINKAFAGSRETLTLFGSLRNKWVGINGSQTGQYFSVHAPLKNQKMALGVELFNQQYAVSSHTGFAFSYTYRVMTNKKNYLAFSLNGGANNLIANWIKVRTIDSADGAFTKNKNTFVPIVGFGVSRYSDQFFAGISIPSFFTQNEFNQQDIEFDLKKTYLIATAGYAFKTGEKWLIQPSFLVIRNGFFSETNIDFNTTLVYTEMLWIGTSYRTNKDAVALVGYQITPQLRFSYSMDYSIGEVGSYNNGTHEFSIQYDFGYKMNVVSPKYF